MNGRISGCVDGQMDEWMCGCMHAWKDGSMVCACIHASSLTGMAKAPTTDNYLS